MAEEGKYIYCIIDASEERRFGPLGIGGRGDEVYTLCYCDIAAVISSSAVMRHPINRENTIAHQRVMEEVMKNHTTLPVRFSTIAENRKRKGEVVETDEQRIMSQVLESRYDEFKDLLAEMSDKRELGVKGVWTDMDTIFAEIVKENQEIGLLNKQILRRPPTRTQAERVKLGELVMRALEGKKAREGERVLGILRKLSADLRQNKNFGDKMFMNVAFLVPTYREQEFDNAVSELSERYDGRAKLKYVGPVPPCNFVEIVVTWED